MHMHLRSPRFPLVTLVIVYTIHSSLHPLVVGTISVLLAVISWMANVCDRYYRDIFCFAGEIKAKGGTVILLYP